MQKHSRYKTARKFLIFWCLFIGIGALAGSVGMLTAPDGRNLGMDAMLPYFQVLPFADVLFQDFIFSGIALLCVNGLTNLSAAVLIFKGRRAGDVCGAVFGFTLMAWIVIQFIIFPLNFMSTIYFIFGAAQAAAGIAACVFRRQEESSVHIEDFKNIGTVPTKLVVYFSRMGYTKKAAYEQADKLGAAVFEVKSTEKTAGTSGFWWCGRFGMHRWDMPIEQPCLKLAEYESVTICTPVWVFHLSAPVRSFCRAAHGQIKNVNYIITHYQQLKYQNVVHEMDSLLGVFAAHAESICVRRGRVLWSRSI